MASRRVMVGSLVVLPLVLFAAAPREAEAPPEPERALVQWAGAASKHPAGFALVLDQAAWRALWSAHTGSPASHSPPGRHAAPIIDFTRCMVVAWFTGPTTNTDGVLLETVAVGKDLVRLRVEHSTFQTAGQDGRGGAVDTTPFGIWVIPRSDAPIVVEEARRSLKRDPVTWVEVHRFKGR